MGPLVRRAAKCRARYAAPGLIRRTAKRRAYFLFISGSVRTAKRRAGPDTPRRGTLAGVFPARILRK